MQQSKQNMASLNNEAAASSSSSSLPLSSTDHQTHYTYEVFLSFRGEDTRYNFTDHLYNALCQRGIETFRDDKLRRGEDISQELLNAIEESRVSIVVFSKNYASSRWCLDELVKILERKSKGQKVRAVFYKVDPSDVRKQKGAFGGAFAKIDQRKYKDSMGKWRAALKEAADLSGWPFKDGEYEAEFIKKIVCELSTQVINPSCDWDVAEHPIGLDSCRQAVNSLLKAEENIVRRVGIWGPGGIGKTTIAKYMFNSIHREFEGSCFLMDVRSNSNDMAKLQETLLSDILTDPNLKVSDVDKGVRLIKTRMRRKSVLLILDDVSDYSQFQKLVPSPDCFGPGSRILITTRDKGWLTGRVDEVYMVKMLNDDQALELFSLHAFKRNGPLDDYLKLARRAVDSAGGLPLALILLGSHLYCKSRDEWEATLDGCRGEDPHRKIKRVLQRSYDALGIDLQGCFLDIACFFKGKYVDDVKPILEACYDLKSGYGIPQLEEKALIRIDEKYWKGGGSIWMHDLIEEMGKGIACQEGEPSKGSRLWNYDDIYCVLTDNIGTETIKGIQVQAIKSYQRYDEICLNAKSFSEMKYLRYFSSSSSIEYSGNIDYLPNELRWLNWSRCSIQSFPSNFYPRKLVALNFTYSPHITRLWEGVKNSPLTHMDLRGCKSLTELPDFTRIPNLKVLNLLGCESLVEVHQSVGFLHKLVTLDLGGCYNIVKLPSEISLKSLLALDLSDCTRLEKFPKITGKMDSLRKLILSHTGVKELHLSIGNLIGLNQLCLVDCKNLTTLPCSICELQNLVLLDVSGCSKLVTFPELPPHILQVNAGDCESLERFLIFPKSLKKLEMNLWNCHRFSYSLGYDMEKMKNILLNNQYSQFRLVLPGSEVPKWFHCSKEVAANEKGPSSTCAISYEIPSKLNWENIGVAVCSVSCYGFWIDHRADISINGVLIDECSWLPISTADHMWLTYIPLSDEIKGKVDQKIQKGGSRYQCRVQLYPADQIKSCGVHVVCQPPKKYSNKIVMAAEPADDSGMLDWLSLSCANPEQKRPRNGAADDYHHQQEQQEQPIGMIPSKRLCTEEQPSMAHIPIINNYSDYSASASTSDMWWSPPDQIVQTSDWQATLDVFPNSQLTLANLDPTSPATPEFQQ